LGRTTFTFKSHFGSRFVFILFAWIFVEKHSPFPDRLNMTVPNGLENSGSHAAAFIGDDANLEPVFGWCVSEKRGLHGLLAISKEYILNSYCLQVNSMRL
jgi:hypothetical protein